MARIRTIKPEFFRSDQVGSVSALARLMFIGMWTMADRRGRLEDRPKRIKIECLPYDDCDPEALIEELASAGLIDRYEADGFQVIQVTTFEKHQRITGSEAQAESDLPAKPEKRHKATTTKQKGNNEETAQGNTQETPGTTEGRKEGKGKEGKERIVADDSSMVPVDGPVEAEVVDDEGVPESLRSPGFLKAWAAWRKYRKERRKPLTPSTVEMQLADLEKHGPEVAAAMIRQSILKGWEGLFPVKDDKPSGSVADIAAQRLQKTFGPNWREEIGIGGRA